MKPGLSDNRLERTGAMHILPYTSGPAEFRAHDVEVAKVAQALADVIRDAEPRLQVEHIGSTSVPGCGGKGIIDLAVLYPEGLLEPARNAVDGLGFQKQGGPEPFPEERPMRVGAVEHGGTAYRIHAHVIPLAGEEHRELVWFRDRLRTDPGLRLAYQQRKKAIFAAGISDSLEYCKAKGDFITETLSGLQSAIGYGEKR